MITLARTLLHHDGMAGLVLFLLASVGAVHVLFSCGDFLLEHFELTRNGRFRLGRRWYHPRAVVLRNDQEWIVATWCQESPWGTWVLAYPLDDESDRVPMEWFRLAELTPGPTWRERRRDRAVAA